MAAFPKALLLFQAVASRGYFGLSVRFFLFRELIQIWVLGSNGAENRFKEDFMQPLPGRLLGFLMAEVRPA